MRTDADGRARATWTLANYPGRQTLFATVENVDSALAIIAEADPVAANTRVTALVDGRRVTDASRWPGVARFVVGVG